jgi:hypothetical protein
MEIKLEPIYTGKPFAGTVTTPETALTQRDQLTAESAKLTAITTEEEQETGVAYLRDVNTMLKITEKSRKEHKEPFLEMGRTIDKFAATFCAPLEKEKDRLSGLVNHFQRSQLEEKQVAETKARKDQEDAAKAATEAAKAIAEAEKKNDTAALLEAQLKAEEAAMTAQSASAVLTAPTNTPKGLSTRVGYDFEITDPFEFAKYDLARFFWKTQDDNETLSVNRACLKFALNDKSGHAWLPPEGQDSITHPFGIRCFRSVATHVR